MKYPFPVGVDPWDLSCPREVIELQQQLNLFTCEPFLDSSFTVTAIEGDEEFGFKFFVSLTAPVKDRDTGSIITIRSDLVYNSAMPLKEFVRSSLEDMLVHELHENLKYKERRLLDPHGVR